MPCQKSLLAITIVSGLLVTSVAFAADVQVDCSGTNQKVFQTISDALNSLDLIGPHTITVSGTCHESVVVWQRDRITIQAVPGFTATIQNAAEPASTTFLVFGSHNIILDHLIIQGGTPALYVTSASGDITMQDCILQRSLGDGLIVEMNSELVIQNSTIRNNAGSGVVLSNESFITFGTYPDQRNRIIANGGFGVNMNQAGAQVNFGRLTIDSNKWAGINMNGGHLLFFGGESGNPAIVRNNGVGIWITNGGAAALWGAARIANNQWGGLVVQGSSAVTLYESTDSAGKKAVVSVLGHTGQGVVLMQSASAQIYGAHVIRDNGSALDPRSTGIWAEGSSLTMSGASVINNVGPGIWLTMKSDVNLDAVTIARNTAEGVREMHLSAGRYTNPLTFVGNGGGGLYCDNLSVAFGDVSSIPGVNCANVSKAESPTLQFAIPHR